MPAARAFPLVKLMNALQSYQNERWDYNNASLTSVKTLAWKFDFWLHFHMFHHSNQIIFIEYIMLDGVNDQEEHAHQLGKLLETFKAVRHYYITSFYHYYFALVPL